MKQVFVLSIALLLSFTYGADLLSSSPSISPTPEPSSHSDCSTVIYNMMDCLSFLTVGSTDKSPTKTCCVGVESVLEYNPKCLCVGLEGAREMGFVLDNTRALAIPSTCKVPIHPHCDVSSPAAPTPAASTVSPTVEPPKSSPSTPSSPKTNPSSPKVTPSPPAATHSSPTTIRSSPATTALSPTAAAPSPSKSDSGNLLLSKFFLAVVIVSSFAYISA